MYGGFAGVYDELMNDVDYPAWSRHYQALMAMANVDARRVMDCACGTGNMTFELLKLGYQLTGADTSVDMLARASEKARAMGRTIPFIRQDMRRLQTHRPMDAVVCACDGVNYLLTDADVLAFFRAAYSALRPGGGLFFDISSMYKLERVLADNTFGEDRDDVCYLWQNRYDTEKRLHHMGLTFFSKGPDGRYDCFREEHTQRAWQTGELLRMLSEAGFKNAAAYGGMTLLPPSESSERVHFSAAK